MCFRQEDFGEGRRGRGGGGGEGRAGPGSGPGAMADPEERLGLEPEDSGGMDPDHPLLARAQAALKAQLVTARENVESELREKHESLRVRDLSGDARTCAHLADRPALFTRGAPPPRGARPGRAFVAPPSAARCPRGASPACPCVCTRAPGTPAVQRLGTRLACLLPHPGARGLARVRPAEYGQGEREKREEFNSWKIRSHHNRSQWG